MELRDDVLGRMVRKGAVEPGHLPILAGIAAALGALDDIAILTEMEAARAVVSDDGRVIRLTLYRDADALAAVELSPERAIALARRLLDAARLRLASTDRCAHQACRTAFLL